MAPVREGNLCHIYELTQSEVARDRRSYAMSYFPACFISGI